MHVCSWHSVTLFYCVLSGTTDPISYKRVKIVPHINDTLLMMLVLTQRAPFADPWVTEKAGVIGHILFGPLALGLSKAGIGFIGACAWLAALFHVAVSKMPLLLS